MSSSYTPPPPLYRLTDRPRLKPTTTLDGALRHIGEASMGATSVAACAADGTFERAQRDFLAWVAATTVRLRNHFVDAATLQHLEDDRFWHIRSLTAKSPRWQRFIVDTVQDHQAWLADLEQFVKRLKARFEASPGRIAVVDTNVLLHFQPLAQIPWPEFLEEVDVRLVVPLRVVEELDEKKYLAREAIAARARQLISQLRSLLGETAGGPAALAGHVTVEVPIEEEPRRRSMDADAEILALCSELQFAPVKPLLVTDDGGMELRARALGFEVRRPPEKYLR